MFRDPPVGSHACARPECPENAINHVAVVADSSEGKLFVGFTDAVADPPGLKEVDRGAVYASYGSGGEGAAADFEIRRCIDLCNVVEDVALTTLIETPQTWSLDFPIS